MRRKEREEDSCSDLIDVSVIVLGVWWWWWIHLLDDLGHKASHNGTNNLGNCSTSPSSSSLPS